MVVIDNIDMNILELLSRDGRVSAIQISKNLAEQGISLTSRLVLNRMKRLEKYRIIQGYTARLSPTLFVRKESIMVLIKFVSTPDITAIRKLTTYLYKSPFCFFAIRMVGEAERYDYACHLVFDTEQKLDLQLKLFLNTFGNLIAHYQVYKSKIEKETPLVLPSSHNMEGVNTSLSLNERTTDEQSYTHNKVSRYMDEMAEYFLAKFGQF